MIRRQWRCQAFSLWRLSRKGCSRMASHGQNAPGDDWQGVRGQPRVVQAKSNADKSSRDVRAAYQLEGLWHAYRLRERLCLCPHAQRRSVLLRQPSESASVRADGETTVPKNLFKLANLREGVKSPIQDRRPDSMVGHVRISCGHVLFGRRIGVSSRFCPSPGQNIQHPSISIGPVR